MASEESTAPGVSGLGKNLAPPASLTGPPEEYLEATRNKSLKRSRAEPEPTFPNNISNAGLRPSSPPPTFLNNLIANAGPRPSSPSQKSPRFEGAFSPGHQPIHLTGAAALADAQRERENKLTDTRTGAISENPNHKVLSSLMAGGGSNMSRPQDGPAPVANMGEGTSAASNHINVPSPMQFDDTSQTSPASITSLASLGSTARTVTAGSTVVASPASMASAIEAENRDIRAHNGAHLQAPSEQQASNRALSFPGNHGRLDPSRIPPRGMSLPMPGPGQQIAPRSPSQKKHKCQYCATEFTRHHNLKSHLLTHSQEKPYVCQTCNMRFRRLHDLKRHMKLHTGERPHICPKCDRKFARGDALARHSKGQGGCAGRRASMGSFGGDDDFEGSNAGDGDEGMDGVMYTNGTPQIESDMTEEERRRFSLPSIKAQHVGSNPGSSDNYEAQSRTPSTYPPVGPRPGQSQGGLYPPITERGGSSSSNASQNIRHSPSASMASLNTGGSSMFSQSAMTESPKPLSPSGMHAHQLGHDTQMINRQRSPSLTTQFQQQHFGRRQSSRNSPPNPSLPSPRTSHTSKLPGLSSLAPPEQRYTLSSQTPGQLSSPNGPQTHQSSGSTSGGSAFHPSQGSGSSRSATNNSNHQASGSIDSNSNIFASEGNAFAHIQQLEDKNKQLIDKIHSMEDHARIQDENIRLLSDELATLRNLLRGPSEPQHPPTSS